VSLQHGSASPSQAACEPLSLFMLKSRARSLLSGGAAAPSGVARRARMPGCEGLLDAGGGLVGTQREHGRE
jgi:hypothetical protein